MNTENRWAISSISPASIEAILRQARADRAQVMRQELAELPALFRRLVAYVRANGWHFPHAGARAYR